MNVKKIEMLLTQIWLAMFGLSVGCTLYNRDFIIVPIVLVTILLFYKMVDEFIYRVEKNS